jgi:tetratricopeptide (TPR) repeat protein
MIGIMCQLAAAEDIPQFPDEARVVYERALKNQDAGNFADALADYKKAGELAPHWFDVHFGLSSLLAEQKKYAEAIEALGKALQVRPGSYSALFNRGYYYELQSQYDKAILAYGEAVGEDVDYSYHVGKPFREP